MLSVMINDQETRLDSPRNLARFLEERGYPPKGLAVVVNGCFVPRSELPATEVRDGDRIHVLTPMSGG